MGRQAVSLPRLGRLNNGNPPGDPNTGPRCAARTRSGRPCKAPAIRGKRRCRMHGGKSTGPRTPEGLERSRRARWKHGRYSEEARKARAAAIQRSLAAMWTEFGALVTEDGFIVEPVRRRGFHGFKFTNPRSDKVLFRAFRRLPEVIEAQKRRRRERDRLRKWRARHER